MVILNGNNAARVIGSGTWLMAACALAAVAYLTFGPRPEDLEPLPWDMSHHVLGAEQMARTLSAGSWADVWRAFTATDLYPPGHSLLLGAWFVAFGDSLRSMMAFQVATLLAALVAMALVFRPPPSRTTDPARRPWRSCSCSPCRSSWSCRRRSWSRCRRRPSRCWRSRR